MELQHGINPVSCILFFQIKSKRGAVFLGQDQECTFEIFSIPIVLEMVQCHCLGITFLKQKAQALL
uniref:Uncharacterized protein n=1 Tax=Rhizophora mucronata TaxID=61149 RepID=A0A2P2Q4Y4_RHIMU